MSPDCYKDESLHMRRAMNDISEEHRNILILVCAQNKRYAEASDILQIPVNTVRTRLTEARNELQRLMSGIHDALSQDAIPGNSVRQE